MQEGGYEGRKICFLKNMQLKRTLHPSLYSRRCGGKLGHIELNEEEGEGEGERRTEESQKYNKRSSWYKVPDGVLGEARCSIPEGAVEPRGAALRLRLISPVQSEPRCPLVCL